MVRDVQNSTSRAAANRLVGSSCMGVPSDSFLYRPRATQPPATICCRHFWRNLTLVPWPKNWVIPNVAWFKGAISHLKLKKLHQNTTERFPIMWHVVLAMLMSLWLLIAHQTHHRETSFAFGGCSDFWKHTQAHRR